LFWYTLVMDIPKWIARGIGLAVNLLIVLLVLSAIAVQTGHFVGRPLQRSQAQSLPGKYEFLQQSHWREIQPGVWGNPKQRVVFSEVFSGNVTGYGGAIPLLIWINEDGAATKIELGEHAETPSYVESTIEAGLLKNLLAQWATSSPDAPVDVISGATLTSNAIIESFHRSRDAYFQLTPRKPPSTYQRFGGWKTLAALAALTLAFLFGMSPPKKRGRTALLIVNVVVLGCLAGTFLTIGKLLSWLAHGVSLQNDLIPILMLALLVVAILVGRRAWYCAWVCPFGSLQELLARRIPWRWKPSPRRQKQLRLFRSGLWLLLLFAGWTLGMVDVFGYEPFGAFQWEHASAVVLGVAAMGIILSLFLPRGYCRCLCPTGALLEFLESKETEK
jgi:uncharacterized protein with FMN-binding domain